MAKHSIKMPSKAQRAKEERQWRAEGMAKDTFMASKMGKKMVREAMMHMEEAETEMRHGLKSMMKMKE